MSARLAVLQRRLLTDRAEAEEFGRRAKRVETLRTRRTRPTALVERASRDAELAARAWEARQALVQSVSGYEDELPTLGEQIAAHAELRTAADERRGGASAMHRTADEAHRLALRRYQEADADYRWMRDAHELERVRADREALAEADREVEAAQAETRRHGDRRPRGRRDRRGRPRRPRRPDRDRGRGRDGAGRAAGRGGGDGVRRRSELANERCGGA